MTPRPIQTQLQVKQAAVSSKPKVITRHVLMSLGTDVHPFDRAVEWFDSWLAIERPQQIEAFVQRGYSKPGSAPSVEYFAFHDLVRELQAADVVITHGGPGSIVECRRAGKLPIVVPRDPTLGEHVDNHQQLFCERMAAAGQILIARTEDDFRSLLDDMVANPQTLPPQDQRHVDMTVRRVGQIVERLVAGRRR